MKREGFDDAVGLIYRAVEEPGLWAAAFDAILALESAATGSLTIFDGTGAPTGFVCSRGFTPEAQRLYGAHFYKVDPLAGIWRRPTAGAVFGHDLIPAAEFECTEIWNDYSRVHLDAFHLLCASVALTDGRTAAIGVHRGRTAAPFGSREKARLDRLLPHLQAGLRLRHRLAAAAGPGLGAAVLDALDLGLVVARADGTVAFANAAALASPALTIGASRRVIAATDPAAGRRLLALVRDAATGGPGGAVLLGAGGRPAAAALVTRLPPGLAGALPGSAGLALVALPTLDGPRPTVAARLRALFGLTGAEATLALALLAGRRLEEVAEERAVRISTIRFQLRAILDKTGTRGQSDLVRLLGRVIPFRGDGGSETRSSETN